jgi:hypothetical protein
MATREIGPLDVLGMSREVRAGMRPLYGVRLAPENGTSGWFFWAGEKSPRGQRFEPTCVAHACVIAPEIERFLNLPPGHRVRIGLADEGAWRDDRLDRLEQEQPSTG